MNQNPYSPSSIHDGPKAMSKSKLRYVGAGMFWLLSVLSFFLGSACVVHGIQEWSALPSISDRVFTVAAIWLADGLALVLAGAVVNRGRYRLGIAIACGAIATFLIFGFLLRAFNV